MSSEDSRTTSSSRLSQFGIYRSIDARTEEFLRLSRKRQIRQGCACAAVSTAITVTIVITVLLVYEYTMNLDSNQALRSRMAAWHSIFNDTSPFEVKYNKAKINIDPTTLKLLPLVLKALNQNRYLEKFIENSNLETGTEGKNDPISIDTSFKKNLFHGTKIKPTQSAQTTDFKTHAVGYKTTFNNMDYYKKIRQEKNNNRMLHYFDKMTNVNTFDSSSSNSVDIANILTTEPINFNETIPKTYANRTKIPIRTLSLVKKKERLKNFSRKQKNTTQNSRYSKQQKYTTQITTTKPQSIISLDGLDNRTYKTNSLNWNQRTSHKTSTKSCNCSKTLAILLSKLLTDIKNIIPEIELYKKSCEEYLKSTTTSKPIPMQTMSKNKLTTPTLTFAKKNTHSNYKPRLNLKTKGRRKSTFNSTTKHDMKLPNTFNYFPHITFANNKTKITTTIKPFIDPTYSTEALEGVSTEPMNKSKSKHIWEHILDKNPTAPCKHNILTIGTNKTSNIKDDAVNHTESIKFEQPHFLKRRCNISSENTDLLNFVDNNALVKHSHDNLYMFPLLALPGKQGLKTERKKHKTASLIEWFDKLKTEKKNSHQYKFNFKGENKPILHIQETTTEPGTNLSTFINKKEIEPKLNNNLNVLNDISKYQESKNITHKRKRIYPIWPEEDENYTKYIANKTVLPLKAVQPAQKIDSEILSVINNLNQKTNVSEFDDNKEKTKRNSQIQQQNTTSFSNSHEVVNKHNLKIDIMDENPKFKKIDIAQGFQTNRTVFIPSPSRLFFSKFAEINNLLYQTKNISNTTIYEKFNFGQDFNHTDDNNTLGTLEYDEFKFLNDEIKEKESVEVRFTDTEKYQTVKTNYENSDDTTKFIKSMLPISRPVFLEIQRNDWKHDNRDLDYGNNDNNFE